MASPPQSSIGIFGAGHVTGICFAKLGHRVIIRDIVPERIERLRAGFEYEGIGRGRGATSSPGPSEPVPEAELVR